MAVLTLDLGTTVAKAAIWEAEGVGLVGLGRSHIPTARPAQDRVEQDPNASWTAAVDAVGLALDDHRQRVADRRNPQAHIEAIAFTGARESFVLIDEHLQPTTPVIVWSDRRAADQAIRIADAGGSTDTLHQTTGHLLGAGSAAAKLLWLTEQDPAPLQAARHVLAPRDHLALLMTGELATDTTMASRAGFPELLEIAGKLAGAPLADLLPPVVESTTVVGHLLSEPARSLGLPAGIPVVIGAGDRACEVLGAGATPIVPMVSWGTTANVTLPEPAPVPAGTAGTAATAATTAARPVPPGVVRSAGALGGTLLECGLAGAGSVLGWLAGIARTDAATLAREAATVAPGAGGVIALPWLDGARAPWWDAFAAGAFLGLRTTTTRAQLARAVLENVALDIARSLTLLAPGGASETAGALAALALAGGSHDAPWPDIVSAACALPARSRTTDVAASAGAALVASAALGLGWDLDAIDPPAPERAPDPATTAAYAARRPAADAAARAVLDLRLPATP